MVFSLWAIVNTVQFLNSVRIVFCSNSSVSKSMAAVASSKIKIFVFLNTARAKHINCRCPMLQKIRRESGRYSFFMIGNFMKNHTSARTWHSRHFRRLCSTSLCVNLPRNFLNVLIPKLATIVDRSIRKMDLNSFVKFPRKGQGPKIKRKRSKTWNFLQIIHQSPWLGTHLWDNGNPRPQNL